MDAGELRPRFSKRRQPDALERFGQNLAVRADAGDTAGGDGDFGAGAG
jgi:hypothetical protein